MVHRLCSFEQGAPQIFRDDDDDLRNQTDATYTAAPAWEVSACVARSRCTHDLVVTRRRTHCTHQSTVNCTEKHLSIKRVTVNQTRNCQSNEQLSIKQATDQASNMSELLQIVCFHQSSECQSQSTLCVAGTDFKLGAERGTKCKLY